MQPFKHGNRVIGLGVDATGTPRSLLVDTQGNIITSGGAAPASGWWLGGNLINSGDCYGAWAGKGSASYAASLVNLNSPGTHNLIANANPGTPTWDTTYGWTNLGPAGSYFTIDGGWFPTNDMTVIYAYTNAGESSMQFGGASDTNVSRTNGISYNNVGAFQQYFNWGESDIAWVITGGAVAIAGKKVYWFNWATDGDAFYVAPGFDISAGTGTNAYDWFFGTENFAGTPHGGDITCKYWAFASYNRELTQAELTAVSTAMFAAGLSPTLDRHPGI